MAAALTVKHAATTGLKVAVWSAGLESERRAIHPLVVQILAERGIGLGRTQSQALSPALVDESDLILTMTGEHAIAVAARYRQAKTKVFMLDHFAQLARPTRADEDLEDWLAEVRHHRRSYPDHPGACDVLDPIGKSEETFRAISAEIDELTARVAEALGTGPS